MNEYPEFAIQRPFIVGSGFPATYIESNVINAYAGEWIVFQIEIAEGEMAELRIPFEAGLDTGILKVVNEASCVEYD